MTEYEAVIGLEVHAQLLTRTKLFCGCPSDARAEPNRNVCPVCLGLPGALPVLNGGAVALAIRAILGCGGEVQRESRFTRKSYFYSDLAKGYQISQYALPVGVGGRLVIDGRTIRLNRIHMEEDAAKNLHGRGGNTVVDFNRGGTPLIEIVSEPDLRSAAEAEAYLRVLRERLMFLGVNDGNLEEGSFRCDANVSIRPVGTETYGTRVELKNINSFRFVRKALEHEIARQQAVRSGGGEVHQETRHYSEATGTTEVMRSKEEAMDYRYFPDPDLPPLQLEESFVATVRDRMPPLPDALRASWLDAGLTEQDAEVLSAHPAIARYFGAVLEAGAEPKPAANFVQAEVLRHLTTRGLEADVPVPPDAVAELLALVKGGSINGKIAKKVFQSMVATGARAEAVVEREGLAQVTDASAIEAEVQKVLDASPKQVEQYRGGKTAVMGYFVGQVMKATRGQANAQVVKQILERLLSA